MRPLVLVQTARVGIKATVGLPATAHEVPSSNAFMALHVGRPSLVGTHPKEENIRGCGGGRDPIEAVVLRLQKSCRAQQPVKAVVDRVFGPHIGFSNHEKLEGLERSKRSKTKSTGAAF